ncbi:hypothetical protein ABIB38_003262 [Massilia sp. UYP11]|uniref:hypothetical protein n=1 Tax=Massilia sp. UYP11 TaxID=1756385 RepID=UPI003D2587F0
MRRIVHILLLLCLPLYGFAMQGGLPPVAGAVSLAHALEHDQGIPHHHHEDDGSVHYDAPDATLDHAHEHSSPLQPVGVGFPRLVLPVEPPVSEPGPYIAHAVPEPFLDGPHRPPAVSLGHAAGGSLHA